MKIPYIVPFVSAIAMVSAPAVVTAQPRPEPIEIRATSSIGDWQKDTSTALAAGLARAPSLQAGSPNESVVQVAFQIDADGRATNLQVLPGDGNFAARRAALFAVRTLDTLDEMPSSSAGRPILANVILYQNGASLARLQKQLADTERVRLASAGAVFDFVTIGALPVAAG